MPLHPALCALPPFSNHLLRILLQALSADEVEELKQEIVNDVVKKIAGEVKLLFWSPPFFGGMELSVVLTCMASFDPAGWREAAGVHRARGTLTRLCCRLLCSRLAMAPQLL